MSDGTLATKAAKGVAWNYLSFGLGKGLVLVTTAVLARLLTPEQFGVVGFATLAVSYLAVLKDLGLGAALIQRQDDVEGAADTVFTLNLLLGGILTLLAVLVAPLVAAYFREPEVIPILRVLAFNFVINALGAIHTVRLQRQLDFRRKALPDIGRSLVKGIVSIGLALAGFGVWSLIVGQMASSVAGVALSWWMFPWRPQLRLETSLVRQMLNFGLSVIGTDGLTILNDTLDYLLVGRLLGSVALGIYTLAYRLPELLVLNLLWVLSAVLYPAYASVQRETAVLEQAFWATTRYIELAVMPLCLGLMITADPLIRVVFGIQWLEAIPVMRLLALYALVRSIGYHIGDVYKAMGRPDILLKLGVISLLVLFPALWFGARYGLVGVALAHALVALARTLVRWLVAARMITIRGQDIWAALKPSLLGGGGLLLLALPTLLLSASLSPLVQLVVTAVAGAAGYLTVLWFIERNSLRLAGRYIGIKGVGS